MIRKGEKRRFHSYLFIDIEERKGLKGIIFQLKCKQVQTVCHNSNTTGCGQLKKDYLLISFCVTHYGIVLLVRYVNEEGS